MRDYELSSDLMERIIHKYNQTENKQRSYGTDMKLSQREIHTINFIGNNIGINITQLAALQGITKGAVSQMVYKLVDKGLVVKSVSLNSDSEVRLELTQEGTIVYNEHKKFHQDTDKKFFKLLKNIPDETYNEMIAILKEFEKMLDETLKESKS